MSITDLVSLLCVPRTRWALVTGFVPFSSLPQKCHLACGALGQLAGTRRLIMADFVLASRGFAVSRMAAGDFGGFGDHEKR